MKFSYPAEKFSQARRCLMLPHSVDEAESLAQAFHECMSGMHKMDKDSLDDVVRSWVCKLEDLMNTDGIDASHGSGTWRLKAEQLSQEQKLELSRIVDELAHWFDREDT